MLYIFLQYYQDDCRLHWQIHWHIMTIPYENMETFKKVLKQWVFVVHQRSPLVHKNGIKQTTNTFFYVIFHSEKITQRTGLKSFNITLKLLDFKMWFWRTQLSHSATCNINIRATDSWKEKWKFVRLYCYSFPNSWKDIDINKWVL